LGSCPNNRSHRSPRYRTESLSAAEKALQLDPTLAEAHVALGLAREIYDWNWKAAEQCFKRAIELNPNSWSAHSEYGILQQRTGRSEAALPELKRSAELNPTYWGAHYRLAMSYIAIGDHRLAVETLRKSLEFTDQSNRWIAPALGWELLREGSYDTARQILGGTPSQGIFADAAQGNRKEVMTKISQLEKEGASPTRKSLILASTYALLGEEERAIAQIENLFNEDPYQLIDIKVNPYWYRLHSHPRFVALLKKIGLDP
jgi:eukaryotic-like serine/threonine-protein kinase